MRFIVIWYVCLTQANVYFYSSKFIQHDVRGTSGAAAPKVALQISNLMTIGSIYDLVISILNKSSEYIPSMKSYLPFTLNTDSCQIFFLNEGNEYAREVQKKVANSSSPNDDSFTLEGTLLSKKRETLGQTLREVGIHLDASCAFIVDVKKYDGFFFDVKSNEKSDSDDEMFNMKGSNKSALNNTWKTNSRFGGSSNHQSAETYRLGISKMGVVGLKNLGNTCYMNSALQCLSNCKELTEYFLKNEHKQDENPDNVLGSKCKLVEAYAGLVNRLWYGDEDRIAPSDFKYEIGNFQSAVGYINIV